MEFSASTATAGFATAESPLDDTAAQDLFQRRQGAQRSPTLVDKTFHVLRLYSRKPRLKQLSLKEPYRQPIAEPKKSGYLTGIVPNPSLTLP